MDFDKTQPTMDPRQAPELYFLPLLAWKRQLNRNIPKILYFLFSLLGLLKPCASASPASSLSLVQEPLSSPLCEVSVLSLCFRLFCKSAMKSMLCFNPRDYSPAISSLHGILQARISSNGLLCPFQGTFQNPGLNSCLPEAPALQADSLPLSHQGSPHVTLLLSSVQFSLVQSLRRV